MSHPLDRPTWKVSVVDTRTLARRVIEVRASTPNAAKMAARKHTAVFEKIVSVYTGASDVDGD